MIINFKVQPNDEIFKKLASKKIERILRNERNRTAFENAKTDLNDLVKPQVGWNRFHIKKFKQDKLVLEDGTKIGGGPVVKVVKGATEIILGICTIGPSVELKVDDYMKKGKMFQAVLLDFMASWAVDSTRKQFLEWIKKEIHIKQGFRTSIMLSPGESDWLINDQCIIFNLLKEESEEIGVRLTEAMLMLPLKSLSLLFGAGPNPLGRESGTNCEFCLQREKCRYRLMRVKS